MAYQARTRDPLFDSETQAVLERRGRELVGLLMLASGIIAAMILATRCEDPAAVLRYCLDSGRARRP